jgi:hypothetical protein
VIEWLTTGQARAFKLINMPLTEGNSGIFGAWLFYSMTGAVSAVDSGPQTVLMIIPVTVSASSFTPSVVTTSISTSKLFLTVASVLKNIMPVAELIVNCSSLALGPSISLYENY